MNDAMILADDGSTEIFGMVGMLGIAVVAIGLTVLFLGALVSIIGSTRYAAGGKALWVLASFAFPVLGPLCWFVWGRTSSIGSDPGSGGRVVR